MKVLVTIVVFFSIAAAVSYWRYSAITPCGIIRVQFHRAMLQNTGDLRSDVPKSEAGAAGHALGTVMGATLVGNFVDRYVDGLTEAECLEAIFRGERRGIMHVGAEP